MRKQLTATNSDTQKLAQKYLEGRRASKNILQALEIKWVPYQEAVSHKWGFGKHVTSPSGVILFPISKGVAIARNFYPDPESEVKHLAQINKHREEEGLSPESKPPKYILPSGDRAKGVLYDPFERLNPGTQEPVICATEDVFGAIKTAAKGIRVLSTTGVWLLGRDELNKDQDLLLKDKFLSFMADSDAIENESVCAALARTGIGLESKIGCFPSPDKDQKVGLDEWIDANPKATKDDILQLLEDNTSDPLEWLGEVFLGVQNRLEGRGYTPTEAAKIAIRIRESGQRELLKHFRIEDLRANGFYQKYLKPLGITLEVLKPKERAIRLLSGETEGFDSITDLLVEIGLEADLFHDAEGVAYADVEVEGIRQTHGLRSRGFKLHLNRQLYKRHGQSASREALSTALSTLESIALFDGEEKKVWLRTAELDGKLYLDLGNEKRQVVEIDNKGWRIGDSPPVRFIRPSSQGELPLPQSGGSLSELQNLFGFEGDSWILLAMFLLFCFVPNRTYPVLLLVAIHGSGKTTTAEFLKSLVDPGKAPLIGLKGDEQRMAVAALNRWLMGYDNISSISPEQSDTLCRFATGFGFSARTLFTDTDETIIELARPQMLTAIDHVVTRGDLADRLLTVDLPVIPKEKRLTKSELNDKLEQAKPRILGALLDTLSQTMSRLPDTHPEELPRMADFGLFAIAAEKPLGLYPGQFMEIFERNREGSRQVILEASPLAEALQALLADRISWQGTSTNLLKTLKDYADESVTRSKFWPKASNSLKRQLNRLKPDLQAVGITWSEIRSEVDRVKRIHLEKFAVSDQENIARRRRAQSNG